MKFTIAAIAGVASATSTTYAEPLETTFNNFLASHGKSYGTREEFEYRMQVFAENKKTIEEHNAKNLGGHRMGINHMADWTKTEFKKLLGYKPHANKQRRLPDEDISFDDVPASVDWRKEGAVSKVKNQGLCGSCWAFSAVGAMEGRYAIASGTLTELSPEQLVDCSTEMGNAGCGGGEMDGAFEYAEKTAMDTWDSYPYKGTLHGKCKADEGKAVAKVLNFEDVPANDPHALQSAVAKGPVAIAVDAELILQFYFGGIIREGCGQSLDHGVLLVGYGTEKTALHGETDYWLVKNSWGSLWGERGYFKVLREMDKTGPGVCGLQSEASYPIY